MTCDGYISSEEWDKLSEEEREALIPQASVTASVPLELGDYEGHPFRGNQWTGGHAEGSSVDEVLKNLRGDLPEFDYGTPDKGEVNYHGGVLKAGKMYGDGGKVLAEWDDAKPIGTRTLFGQTYDIYEPSIIKVDRTAGESFPAKSAEPVEHVFRAVSEEDWQRMKDQGYLDTNGSHNIEYLEDGKSQLMNADYEPVTSYLPNAGGNYPSGDGRILRIDYKKEDGWFVAPALDGYIRTDQKVPIDRVSMVSPTIHSDEKWRRSVVASLEFGDYEGHPFHGNQWTPGGGALADVNPDKPGMQVIGHHATSPLDVESIIQNGFDPMAEGGAGSLFGKGTYFSLDTEAGRETQLQIGGDHFVAEVTLGSPLVVTSNDQKWDIANKIDPGAGDRLRQEVISGELTYQGASLAVTNLARENGYNSIVVRGDDHTTGDAYAFDQVVVFDKSQVDVKEVLHDSEWMDKYAPAAAEARRGRSNPGYVPPSVVSSLDGTRDVELISVPEFLKRLDTLTASVPLEFGDVPGHDFHGNQYTGPIAGKEYKLTYRPSTASDKMVTTHARYKGIVTRDQGPKARFIETRSPKNPENTTAQKELMLGPEQLHALEEPDSGHSIEGGEKNIGVRAVKAYQKELDEQGVPEDSPIRGVIDHPGYRLAVSRNDAGEITGALAYSRDHGNVDLQDFRAIEQRTGVGTALMEHVAQGAKSITVYSAVQAAVPFYQKMGGEFEAEKVSNTDDSPLRWKSYGTWDKEATEALASGHPIDKTITMEEGYANFQRRGGNPAFTASANADHSDSAMIAWRPTAEESKTLALPGGETPDRLHCTLLYLGKVADIDTELCADIVRAVADRFNPFVARIQGTAIFNTPDGDVLVRLVDAPQLEQLQQRLHDEIAQFETLTDNHGFTAHITLKYLAPDEDVDPAWFDFEPIDVVFGSIETDFGTERTSFELATEVQLGEGPGHPFRGNQWTESTGGGRDSDTSGEHYSKVTQLDQEVQAPTKSAAALAEKLRSEGPEGVKALFADDPRDAIATDLDLNNAPSMAVIEKTRQYVAERSQLALRKAGQPEMMTVYRGGEPRSEYTSVTLQRDTAKFFADRRPGATVDTYQVPISKVAAYIPAFDLGLGFNEAEIYLKREDLGPVLSRGLTSAAEFGEGPGHPFRGNQWTSGSMEGRAKEVVSKVRSVLTDDLRKPKYRGNPDLIAGQCYVASEATYHMLGGKEAGLKPMFIRHEGEPHWFLKTEDGKIIDPTASQFKTPVPYDEARGKGFLTKEPSARAQEVIDRVHHLTAAVEFGEGPGHPFRGNQWTSGVEGDQDGDRKLSKKERKDHEDFLKFMGLDDRIAGMSKKDERHMGRLFGKKTWEFGDLPGHPFRGNQWTHGVHEVDGNEVSLREWAEAQPPNTMYRAMHVDEVTHILDHGTIGEHPPAEHPGTVPNAGLWVSSVAKDIYLDKGEVIAAIHVKPGEKVSAGGPGDYLFKQLPADRLLSVWAPPDDWSPAPYHMRGRYGGEGLDEREKALKMAGVLAIQPLEFGDVPGHPFRGNQWKDGYSDELANALIRVKASAIVQRGAAYRMAEGKPVVKLTTEEKRQKVEADTKLLLSEIKAAPLNDKPLFRGALAAGPAQPGDTKTLLLHEFTPDQEAAAHFARSYGHGASPEHPIPIEKQAIYELPPGTTNALHIDMQKLHENDPSLIAADDVEAEDGYLVSDTFTVDHTYKDSEGRTVSVLARAVTASSAQLEFTFDEDEHPRDSHGRFTSKGDDGYTGPRQLGGAPLEDWQKHPTEIAKASRTPAERTHIRMEGMQGHTIWMEELQVQGERIATVLPNADVDISQNVNPRYLQAVAESAEQFAAEFPHAAESVAYVLSTNGDPGTIALVRSTPYGLSGFGVTYPLSPYQVGIELNERYFSPSAGKDLDEVVEKASEQTHVGDAYSVPYHRTDDVKGLIDHEFGHVLDHAVGAHTRYIDDETMRQISQYAQTSPKEAFAEAFAMRQAGMPLPTNAEHEIQGVVRDAETMRQIAQLQASAPPNGGETTCAGYVPVSLRASVHLEFVFDPNQPRNEKGEWTSTGGEPRLAPWERSQTTNVNPGQALPFETTSMKYLPKDVQRKVMETVRNRVGSPQAINANLRHYLETAMADPKLREEGMNWYQVQHDVAYEIAQQHGLNPQNVAAALAAMSSGTDWDTEEPILRFMGNHLDAEMRLTDEKLDLVNAKLDAFEVTERASEVSASVRDKEGEAYAAMRSEFPESEDIKAAWSAQHPDADPASLNRSDGVLYGEIVAFRENQAGLIPPAEHLVNGTKYSDIEDPKIAVIAMQAEFMQQPSVADGGTRATGWGAGHGWDGFAKGLTLMRGANVDDTIYGPKVRSFTNNIMDPSDPRDVTVDVHMISAAAKDPKVINDSSVMGSPSYQTAAIGAYPYVADVIRRIADQNDILPQQAQALMWVGFLAEQQAALKKNQ